MNREITMKFLKTIGLLGVLLLNSQVGFTHHSSSGIDPNGSVTVSGTVKEFRWGNPHSWIELEVVNAEGVTELWNFEMNPPVFLIRNGFTRSSLKPGDIIAVTARPFFDARPGGIFMSVELPDGRVLGGR
jgi:hypothetical protein